MAPPDAALLVDGSILTWILLPLVFLTLVSLYVRTHAMRLLAEPKVVGREELAHRNLLARAQRLRANGGFISLAGFAMRKAYFVEPAPPGPASSAAVAAGGAAAAGAAATAAATAAAAAAAAGAGGGRLLAKPEGAGATPNPMDAMKQQMVMMGTQMGLGYFTENFTSGFVALRLPFSLTERFKTMTQAGIGVGALDTTYVSSTSWYMMTMFGLPQVLKLFQRVGGAGQGGLDEARMVQMQMGMVGAAPAGAFNAAAAYAAERENVQLAEWAPAPLLQAERELIAEAERLGLVRGADEPGANKAE
jgi:hypothetical protein